MGCCLTSQNLDQYHQPQSRKEINSLTGSTIIPKEHNKITLIKQQSYSKLMESDPIAALAHKKKGNQLFKIRNYKQAIEQFKLAIIYDQKGNPNFYTNLALSQKANKQFMDSYNTILKMFQIFSPQNLQATLFSKAKIIQARSLIGKVRQYCVKGAFNEQQTNIHKQFIDKSIEILKQLNSSPMNSGIKKLDANIQQQLQKANKVKQYFKKNVLQYEKDELFLEYIEKRILSAGSAKFQAKLGGIYGNQAQLIAQLHKFNRNMHIEQEQDQQQQLFDPITYQQFVSPFIVASGFTYQQKVIKQHFRMNRYQDPITHEQFTEQKTGVVNRTLKRFIAQRGKKINKDDILFIEL